MAGIPAILWLGFFYLMDRHEPEPKQLVARRLRPRLPDRRAARRLRHRPRGAATSRSSSQTSPALSLDRILYAVLIAGLAQEMCKYAVVRYTIYMSREFDEPMDGIVYMMACGTGFAVWVNYHRLSGQGHEVYLSTGAAQAVVTTLAHASFAGALGYVMGRAKFSRRSAPVRGAAPDARPPRRGRAQRPVQRRRELGPADRHGAAPVARRRLCGAVRDRGVRGDLVRRRSACSRQSPFKEPPR